MTTKDKTGDDHPYARDAEELRGGKPAGPEHDGSFHAPDFFDPKTGKRYETDWDSPGQAEAAVAEGVDEKGKVVAAGGLTEADLPKPPPKPTPQK